MISTDLESFPFDLNHIVDKIDIITDEDDGQMLARHILQPDSGANLTPASRYLAIGAGQAVAERVLAQQLGIEESNITLLDKKFRYSQDLSFTGTRVEEDVFSFLEKRHTKRFDLVSVLGMEYVFDTEDKFDRLVDLVSKNMNEGGCVVIFPVEPWQGDSRVWKKHGLVSLHHGNRNNPAICSKIQLYPKS